MLSPTQLFPLISFLACSQSQLVTIQTSPLPYSRNLTTLGAPTTLGLTCLETIVRFERPRTEACAKTLTQMASDARQQEFRHGALLPFAIKVDGCVLRVNVPMTSEPAHTSWQYLQTAATHLMVGCLRVYDQSHIRTGDVIRVGRRGAFVEVSLSKESAPSFGDSTFGDAVIGDE